MSNNQIANHNNQIITNNQIPITKIFEICNLKIGIYPSTGSGWWAKSNHPSTGSGLRLWGLRRWAQSNRSGSKRWWAKSNHLELGIWELVL